MECKEIREMYKLMFAEYPDIVTVKDLQAMLGISRHAAYDLLGEGEISCIRLANAYKIPKINVINSQQPGGQGGPPQAAGVHGKLLQRRGDGKAL